MISSLFMINSSGDIFMEKHWRSVISRSVCDYFFEAQNKATSKENIPPVIATPHHYLISIYRNSLFYVAVVQAEAPPLFVIEFLHRIVDMFIDYFGECTETNIKDNYVVVYELLEEMLDNGYPLATESNVLKELIKPPNILRSVVNTVTGSSNVSDILPSGQLSNVPWRRSGVKYTNNEAYFDVVEEVDCIIDKAGSTVFADIQGSITCTVKLSGMPDLTMSFMNHRIMDDVSFHPCVRYKRWEFGESQLWILGVVKCVLTSFNFLTAANMDFKQSERVISFVPPDGNFQLLTYHVGASNLTAIPLYIKPNISFREGSGKFELTVGPKQTMGKVVENVVLSCDMPKTVLNVTLTTTQGLHSFDPVSKVLSWEVGKITPQKIPSIKGSLALQGGAPPPESNPSINVQFSISQLAISGLKVNRLDIYGEKYKPFKGVKYVTKAGKFQVRT